MPAGIASGHAEQWPRPSRRLLPMPPRRDLIESRFDEIVYSRAKRKGKAWMPLPWGPSARVSDPSDSGNKKHAEHFIPIWDDWTHRLQVGVFLREGNLTAYRRMKARVFRDRLEFLKHAVEEGDRDETREYIGLVNRAYGRMRLAYLQ